MLSPVAPTLTQETSSLTVHPLVSLPLPAVAHLSPSVEATRNPNLSNNSRTCSKCKTTTKAWAAWSVKVFPSNRCSSNQCKCNNSRCRWVLSSKLRTRTLAPASSVDPSQCNSSNNRTIPTLVPISSVDLNLNSRLTSSSNHRTRTLALESSVETLTMLSSSLPTGTDSSSNSPSPSSSNTKMDNSCNRTCNNLTWWVRSPWVPITESVDNWKLTKMPTPLWRSVSPQVVLLALPSEHLMH